MANVPVDLKTFLDHHECTLPRTVKTVDGFCGINDEDTLDTDQIFVFYKVERQKVIMALDEFCQEICVQQNSNLKVYLLPLECHIYSTVQELLTAQYSYIVVLEDISSSEIVSGSKLKLLRDQSGVQNYLKCQVVEQDDPRVVLLPLRLTGKFLPVLDFKDYFLEEVLSQNQLPISVRFTSQSTRASDCVTAHSLLNLGNIRLTHKTEVGMAFAASFDNELSLYTFPNTLDITVSNGFKVSAETSKIIKKCRKALETSETSLKLLDHEVKDSFYFTASPVRRFSLHSLQKVPPMPPPRTLRAKHGKIREEKLYAKIEESKKGVTLPLASNNKRQKCAPSLSISGEFADDGDYENYVTGKMSRLFTDSGRPKEVNACLAALETSNQGINRNSEAPVLPLNRMLSLTGENKVKETKPHGTSRPVPKQRKRLVAKIRSQEMSKDSQMVQTQWQGETIVEITDSAQMPGTPSTEDGFEEICPELPHKPIFLQPLPIANEEENHPTSQEDNPIPLPPKNGEKTCPEQQHNTENKDEEEPCTRGETPPPALPPKKKSFLENNFGLAYLVVDVSDWKTVEDNYHGVYAEVKDDGRVFKENGNRNSYLEVIYQADETKDNPAINNQKPGEKKIIETDCEDTHMLRFSGAGMENEEAKQVKDESSADEYENPCDEINDSHGPLQRKFRFETSTENQKKACAGVIEPLFSNPELLFLWGGHAQKPRTLGSRMIKPSENSSSSHNTKCSAQSMSQKGTSVSHPKNNESNIWISARREESCMDTEDYVVMKGQKSEAKTTYEDMQRLRSGEASMEPKVNRQVKEGSSEDDEPYEDINYSYESSQIESRLEMNTDSQDKVAVKMQTKHSSSNNSSSLNANCSVQTSLQNGTSGALCPRNNSKNIWFSARREEDCMDFKDIEQFFKLRKQLNDARAQVKNLEKQVALNGQDPTEGKRMLLETSDLMASSFSSSNSQHLDEESKDDNMKKLEKKKENLTSVVNEHSAGLITQEGEVSKPNVLEYCDDYHDHDVYEEYYDRKYVNQEFDLQNNLVYYMNVDKNEQSSGDREDDGVEPIYYNTVEIETISDRASPYLQLGNSSDKDENVCLNVNDQDSDRDVEEKLFGTKKMANHPSKTEKNNLENKATIVGNSVFNRSLEDVTAKKESDITKPPPLPPKQRPVGSSVLRDFRT